MTTAAIALGGLGSLPNLLKLFTPAGDVDVDATSRFFEISRNQLAEVLGISTDQIRPDRMSDRVKEKIGQLAYAMELVAVIFDGNIDKTRFWLKTPNPNFGGTSPRELIIRGRYKRVIDFVQDAHQKKR